MKDDVASIISLYERHADAFCRDRGRGPWVEQAWLQRFLAYLPASAHVLDIGCGCGVPMAAFLIERGVELSGVDSSARMIALCRARFPRQHWQVADMREMEPGRSFDGLLAWDSFFHLDQASQRAMFACFARLANPGAMLMFNSGARQGTAVGRYCGEPLYHASLALEEYRMLLRGHGFTVLHHVTEDPDCGQRTVWLARRL